MRRAVHTSTPSISPLHEGGTPLLAPAAEAETENQMTEERSEATGSRLVAELAVPGDWLAPELPPHWHQWDLLLRLASRGLLNPCSSCSFPPRPSPTAGSHWCLIVVFKCQSREISGAVSWGPWQGRCQHQSGHLLLKKLVLGASAQ